MNDKDLLRFLKYVLVNKETGCWEWTGTSNGNGYGRVYMYGKMMGAHRVSYEHYVGAIAPRMQIDHKCRMKRCVNPYHLQQVSNCENIVLAVERKENYQSSKTHCKHGHEFNEENTRYAKQPRSNGIRRQCRACFRIYNRRNRG